MIRFMHWRNFDWSFDSTCIACSATVANAKDEAELAEPEARHVCSEEPSAEQAELTSQIADRMQHGSP